MSDDIKWASVSSESCNATVNGFLDAVRIWCNKPHVANRNLTGSNELWTMKVTAPRDDFELNLLQFVSASIKNILGKQANVFSGNGVQFVEMFSEFIKRELDEFFRTDGQQSLERTDLTVSLRCLIPKQSNKFGRLLELTIIDYKGVSSLFIPLATVSVNAVNPCTSTVDTSQVLLTSNDLVYKIQLHQSAEPADKKCRISLSVLESMLNTTRVPNGCNCSVTWLKEILIRKLARWSEETKLNTDVTSLMLVSVQRYSDVYQMLKEKYGQHLVKIWTEKTDPQKFVYEDIGIASYLIVLWEDERKAKGLLNKQSFVDLGCGNGLLVYLLTMEGHLGIGLDIRKRQIWDVLSSDANLKECTLTPSDSTLFPDYDWLIGNHSDELTPWIPVIAARSHYNCRYFVLPCCAWDFDRRFSSKGVGISQYQSYLDFVDHLGQECGFVVQRDVLRIPSTKRTCLIGKTRNYVPENMSVIDENIRTIIKTRCISTNQKRTSATNYCESDSSGSHNDDVMHHDDITHDNVGHNNDTSMNTEDQLSSEKAAGFNSSWAVGFSARPALEAPRNAVRLSRSLKDHVTLSTYERLLYAESPSFIQLSDGRLWNNGSFVPLHIISSMFDSSVLHSLKKECGGLQTLLKNCPDVFVIREGCVGIRDWTSPDYVTYQQSRRKKRQNDSAKERFKTQLCFHYMHHPASCALSIDECRFAHGTEDIRSISTDSVS